MVCGVMVCCRGEFEPFDVSFRTHNFCRGLAILLLWRSGCGDEHAMRSFSERCVVRVECFISKTTSPNAPVLRVFDSPRRDAATPRIPLRKSVAVMGGRGSWCCRTWLWLVEQAAGGCCAKKKMVAHREWFCITIVCHFAFVRQLASCHPITAKDLAAQLREYRIEVGRQQFNALLSSWRGRLFGFPLGLITLAVLRRSSAAAACANRCLCFMIPMVLYCRLNNSCPSPCPHDCGGAHVPAAMRDEQTP